VIPATLGQALQKVAERLADAGIEDARRDAQVLLGHVIERDRAYLHAFAEVQLSDDQTARLSGLVDRRAARVPMSQVLGSREFWSLDFQVTADTLTPRPDSETLVEAAIEQFGTGPGPSGIADLGTGTGCLLISLLTNWPESRGLGVDRSPEALAVARTNARACEVDARCVFVEGSWFDGIADRFDLIVSNPPYIPSDDLAGLEPEVVQHEPHLALDGGDDGLDAYRALLPQLPAHLTKAGVVVLEHGAGQGPELENLAGEHGLAVVTNRSDLAGLRRCLVLRAG
jgi:release factor glutamine methyltransferase